MATAAASMHIDNPFDAGRDLLRTLQKQVADLHLGLHNEQQERRQDVEAIKVALNQEMNERLHRLQKLDHTLQQECSRLEAAQHRLRYDVGDLRMAVDKVLEQHKTDSRDIRKDLADTCKSLTAMVSQLRADHDTQGASLSNSIELESQKQAHTLKTVETKLNGEDAELKASLDLHVNNFAEYRRALDADYQKTKASTNYLIRDMDWVASNLRAAGLIADTFKNLKWASLGDVPVGKLGAGGASAQGADLAASLSTSRGTPSTATGGGTLGSTRSSPYPPDVEN